MPAHLSADLEPGSVLFAPDGFKGSISAAAAAAALADGWRRAGGGDTDLAPMADGGEGTVDAFASAVPGSRRMGVDVTGPDGRRVSTTWLLLPPAADAPHGSAVIELASTSGIEILDGMLLPGRAQTRGLGEAISAALAHGVSRLIIGIGSSASTDGGTGMLAALGARFLTVDGEETGPGADGLDALHDIDLSRLQPLPPGGAIVLTDVTNPLLGARGAAAVFGPQKGLDEDAVRRADDGLARLTALAGGRPSTPGAGAAGGTGWALDLWGARLQSGAKAVSDLIGLPARVAAASLVVTGEGSFDAQSLHGKAPGHIASLAADARIPLAVVAGRIAGDVDLSGAAQIVSLTELAGTSEAAIADPGHWLREAGALLATRMGRSRG